VYSSPLARTFTVTMVGVVPPRRQMLRRFTGPSPLSMRRLRVPMRRMWEVLPEAIEGQVQAVLGASPNDEGL